MNIFFLDSTPSRAAAAHCDKHVVKMILETAQMLCTAHRVLDGDYDADRLGLYKKTHHNHPSAVWVRGHPMAYEWTTTLLYFLLAEYGRRYGKTHATERLLMSLDRRPRALLWQADAPVFNLRDAPQAMPDQYKVPGDPVTAYRRYYAGEKRRFAKWTKRIPPDWWFKELDKCSSTI